MKNVVWLVAQFFLFVVVDVVGSLFLQPFHVRMALAAGPGEVRTYVWDGVILMVLVYVVLLLIGALRKGIGAWATWTTLALVLAAAAGYGLKLGFLTQNW